MVHTDYTNACQYVLYTAIPNITTVFMDFTVYMHIYIVLLSLCNVLVLSTAECMKGRNLREIPGLDSKAVTHCWYSCFLGKCCSLVIKMGTAAESLNNHVYKVFTSEEQQHWIWALVCYGGVTKHFGGIHCF